MSIVDLSDYKASIVEKICLEKFQNDIMLVFNNFTEESTNYITQLIRNDIRDFESKGIILDNKLIRISCTMYLGIAWSMYKKGKRVQKEKRIIQSIGYNCDDESVETIINLIKTTKVIEVISDIVLRYFTLYLSRYVKDIIERMEISYHPEINDDRNLNKKLLEYLRGFAIKVLAVGIIDESNSMKF